MINGDTSITKNRDDNSYSISYYPANFRPTGRVFCELFPKAYFCKHRDVTSRNAADEKKRIKRGLDSCSAEMCRYYSIASEMGSHAGRSSMDVEVQASPSNPWKHAYHPEHDGLDWDFKTKAYNSKYLIHHKEILDKLFS